MLHQAALSDADGTLTLELSDDNWGDHQIRVAALFAPRPTGEAPRRPSRSPRGQSIP
jgi:hypothetical protein